MCRDHNILGISCNSSQEEIKKAYLVLAKKMHPDIDKSAGSNDRFVNLKSAYERLSKKNINSNLFSNDSIIYTNYSNGIRININGIKFDVRGSGRARVIINGVEIDL